jgi:hypothetical protein
MGFWWKQFITKGAPLAEKSYNTVIRPNIKKLLQNKEKRDKLSEKKIHRKFRSK